MRAKAATGSSTSRASAATARRVSLPPGGTTARSRTTRRGSAGPGSSWRRTWSEAVAYGGRRSTSSQSERERQQVPARALHLPVEAGERAPEARVGEVDGEAGPAVGLEGERRGQLVELGGEILVEAALDVLAEQAGQDEACHHQRAGGPDQAAREQPEAERGRPQGSPSR